MSKAIPKMNIPEATHIDLVQRLRNDEQAAGCPQKAFRLPKSYYLPIAKFRFESPYHVEKALELLRSLEISPMLRHAATAAVTANGSNQDDMSTKATIAGDDQGLDRVLPLYVSLIGLSGHLRRKAGQSTASVYSIAVDHSNRLHSLSNQIYQQFTFAVFEKPLYPQSSDRRGDADLRANILNDRKARQAQKVVDESGREVTKRTKSAYDPQGLIGKYKDVVLADNIPLEKLSLWKNGRKATFQGPGNEILLDEYYEEVESIPLP